MTRFRPPLAKPISERLADVDAALNAGKTMRDVLAERIWHVKAIKRYSAENPEWSARVKAQSLLNANKKKTLNHPKRKKELCVRGHRLAGGNLRWEFRGGYLRRQCVACRRFWDTEGRILKPEKKALLISNLQDGKPISSIGATFFYAIKRERAADPAFDRLIGGLSARNAHDNRSRAQAARPRIFRASSLPRGPLSGIIAAPPAENYSAVQAAVPNYLPRHIRDDVVGDMLLALEEGNFPIADIGKHLRRFISQTYKMHPSRFAPISLDAPAYRDGQLPLIETISEGMWS